MNKSILNTLIDRGTMVRNVNDAIDFVLTYDKCAVRDYEKEEMIRRCELNYSLFKNNFRIFKTFVTYKIDVEPALARADQLMTNFAIMQNGSTNAAIVDFMSCYNRKIPREYPFALRCKYSILYFERCASNNIGMENFLNSEKQFPSLQDVLLSLKLVSKIKRAKDNNKVGYDLIRKGAQL